MSARLWVAAAAVVVLVAAAGAALFTVQQTDQVLVVQFGQPIRVIETPGLHAKVPFLQQVISFDHRLLDYDTTSEEVILGDQRRLIVDSFTMFRITDPLRYFQAVGAQEDNIRARLNSVVTSALRRVLGNETLPNVLSQQRGRIMGQIKDEVAHEMSSFGVQIEDVRIRHADLPPENTQAILNRMKSERERVAKQVRAEGAEAAARITSEADRDRTVILAQARADAERLRGEGEGQAVKIFADAYGRDPSFFETYRTLQAYRDALANGNTRLVLSPDADFLRMLKEAPKP